MSTLSFGLPLDAKDVKSETWKWSELLRELMIAITYKSQNRSEFHRVTQRNVNIDALEQITQFIAMANASDGWPQSCDPIMILRRRVDVEAVQKCFPASA